MTRHIAPTMACNLGCTYCYEEPDRHHSKESIKKGYNVDAIISRLEKWHESNPNIVPGFHGGEPLLIDIDDMRVILEWIDDHYDLSKNSSHIQTNGTRLTEEHVELFNQYNVHVGISFDGPGDLNNLRRARSEKQEEGDITEEMSNETRKSIERLIESDVSLGVIIVLTDQNAGTQEKYEQLHEFMDYLNKNGVSGHFNPAIPYEDVQVDVSLNPEQLKEVYLATWEWMKEKDYRKWDPMKQYQNNLLGLKLGNCVNQKCDVFNAKGAEIAKGNGEESGCGKTWGAVGDGVSFLQGGSTGNEFEESKERYQMLKQVPQEEGGCNGCRYWKFCYGGCPASGGEYDYRNKTLWCEAKYALYEKIEHDMKSMFPGVQLLTELDWDFDTYEISNGGSVNAHPFAKMDPARAKKPSVQGGSGVPGPVELVKKSGNFEDTVDWYKSNYPSDILTIDMENESVHADSR